MTIVLGEICQSFYALGTAVVAEILAGFGLPTRRVVDGHERIFAMLARGEVDIVAAAWLPHSHGHYVAACGAAALPLAKLCVGGRLLWGVPTYVDGAVAGIADLARPEVARRIDKTIRGINPDSGIMRASARALEAYGLAAAGYRVVTGDTADWMANVATAHAENRWLVIPLWAPHYLVSRYRPRALADPLGVLGGTQDGVLMVHRGLPDRLPAPALAALRALDIGNDGFARMEGWLNEPGASAEAAARRWLAEQGR